MALLRICSDDDSDSTNKNSDWQDFWNAIHSNIMLFPISAAICFVIWVIISAVNYFSSTFYSGLAAGISTLCIVGLVSEVIRRRSSQEQ